MGAEWGKSEDFETKKQTQTSKSWHEWVDEALEGNGARADVVALVTELSHSLDDAPVDAEYVANAVWEGNLSRGRFEM